MHRLHLALSLLALVGCAEEARPDPWGDEGFVPGAPLVLDEVDLERWVFVPFEDMRCADGTSSGIFVNHTTRSDALVVFFRGGGVCYDAVSCRLMPETLEGLGPDPLARFTAEGAGSTGIFDRDDETNPLRDASFVVLPHCTGDFHLADRLTEHPTLGELHQVGHANVKAAMRRVVPTFTDASRIVIAGFSAGGVGATGNYHLITQAFAQTSPSAPLPLLVNDSGPLLRPAYLDEEGQAQIALGWELDRTLFRSCPRCEREGFHAIFATLRAIYPELRASLVCAKGDITVRGLYFIITGRVSYLGDSLLREGLLDFGAWTRRAIPRRHGGMRELLYESTRHGALEVAPLDATPGLAEFLRAQLEGDEAWESVH